MALEIRLLGELAVVRDGRVAPLPASRRTRALLGYLAATARPHLRSHLCDLLWEGPDDPRAALRRVLEERMGASTPDVFRFYRPRCDRVVRRVMEIITSQTIRG